MDRWRIWQFCLKDVLPLGLGYFELGILVPILVTIDTFENDELCTRFLLTYQNDSLNLILARISYGRPLYAVLSKVLRRLRGTKILSRLTKHPFNTLSCRRKTYSGYFLSIIFASLNCCQENLLDYLDDQGFKGSRESIS